MNRFVEAARLDEIPKHAARVVEIGDREIALFRAGEEILAIDNVCPHAGGPLGAGARKKNTVFCPIHMWGFDLRTGACDTVSEMRADTFETRVIDGIVHVCLEPIPPR